MSVMLLSSPFSDNANGVETTTETHNVPAITIPRGKDLCRDNNVLHLIFVDAEMWYEVCGETLMLLLYKWWGKELMANDERERDGSHNGIGHIVTRVNCLLFVFS